MHRCIVCRINIGLHLDVCLHTCLITKELFDKSLRGTGVVGALREQAWDCSKLFKAFRALPSVCELDQPLSWLDHLRCFSLSDAFCPKKSHYNRSRFVSLLLSSEDACKNCCWMLLIIAAMWESNLAMETSTMCTVQVQCERWATCGPFLLAAPSFESPF